VVLEKLFSEKVDGWTDAVPSHKLICPNQVS